MFMSKLHENFSLSFKKPIKKKMAPLLMIQRLHGANLFKYGILPKRTFTNLTNQKRKGVQGLVSVGKPFTDKLSSKYLQKRGVALTSVNRTDDACIKQSVEVTCHKKKPPKEKCEVLKMTKATGQCLKVCIPCCVPIDIPPSCDSMNTSLNACKSINYHYPSYAEAVTKVSMKDGRRDCCYDPKCMSIYAIGKMNTILKTKDVQKQKLGLPKLSTRFYSTNTAVEKDKKNSDFQKGLPCLQKSSSQKQTSATKGECKRLCMPCCKPARDPPECLFPYVKPKCKRIRAPRPAFSECQADKMHIKEPCECSFIILQRCDQSKKGQEKVKCAKKEK
uniref:Putative acyl-coa-binding domain-containing protein 4 panstrongylus lignarius n=1 Tax=Rhodnius prolixus TaxID=13249 RepID=A0A4P6D8M9_RHOPR